MSAEPREDRLLDHEYDGIREYDNPMPRWWLATFWVTIVYSVLYVLNIPGVGNGKGRVADYQQDMAAAAALAAANDPLARFTGDSITVAAADPARRTLGAATFKTVCVACHLADGGGSIGPNLTDSYWINGGTPAEIFHTIVNGVPAKGMPPWGKTLKPDQLVAVAGYVTTLKGTTPKTPKAPQGINTDSVAAAAAEPAKR